MAIIAYAVPLVPGAEAEASAFATAVEAHRARYEELNELGTVKRHWSGSSVCPRAVS